MNEGDYFDMVMRGEYPGDPIVSRKVAGRFENDAGEIVNIAAGAFGSASWISSRAGAVRSNHRHAKDWHFIYVTSGVMIYYHRPVGAARASRYFCEEGSLVFTGPGVDHATYFPVETTVVTLQRRARDHESHEADVVRVAPMITSEVCPAVIEGHKCVLPYEVEGRDWHHPHHDGHHLNIHGQEFHF